MELMTLLGKELGVAPVYSQGQWDKLLQVLGTGRIDLVINGYEWTQAHGRDYLATRPYYVYQLQLMVKRGGLIRSWSDLKREKAGGGRWKVGVLVSSAADTFATEDGGATVEVVRFDGATDAMLAVQNGQFDATLQDLPAALFYQRRFPGLACRPVSQVAQGFCRSMSARRMRRFGMRLIKDSRTSSNRASSAVSTKSMESGLRPSRSSRRSRARSSCSARKQAPRVGHSSTSTGQG